MRMTVKAFEEIVKNMYYNGLLISFNDCMDKSMDLNDFNKVYAELQDEKKELRSYEVQVDNGIVNVDIDTIRTIAVNTFNRGIHDGKVKWLISAMQEEL